MKRCPKCGCERFIVSQHVAQTVIVDGNGNFILEQSSCDEVLHAADDDDLWECENCGHSAAGAEFNVDKDGCVRKNEYIRLGIYDDGEVLLPGPTDVFIDVVHDYALIRKINGLPIGNISAGIKVYDANSLDYDIGHITKAATWKAIVENGLADCIKDDEEDNPLRFVLKSKYPIETEVFDLLYKTYPKTELSDILWLCERLNAAKWALEHGADKDYDGLIWPMKEALARSENMESREIFHYVYGSKKDDYLQELYKKQDGKNG